MLLLVLGQYNTAIKVVEYAVNGVEIKEIWRLSRNEDKGKKPIPATELQKQVTMHLCGYRKGNIPYGSAQETGLVPFNTSISCLRSWTLDLTSSDPDLSANSEGSG